MMTENPCRFCTDRDPYCHSTCQKYKDWKVLHEAEKAAIAKDRNRYSLTYAQKRAFWVARRRDQYSGVYKKFSS